MAKKQSSRKAAPAKKPTPTRAKAVTTKRERSRPPARRTAKRDKVPAVNGRAIFIDVENTSSEAELLKVLDHLHIDRKAQPTQLYALGNWKSVGTRVARTLAGLGAQLIHSAPAVGVRDWSDLWIAVAAGRWLASATPGDLLDIVSDDRAFDAVGDAAAAAGVVFRRTSYRAIPGATAPPPSAGGRPRRRRRGGRGRTSPAVTAPSAATVAPPAVPSVAAPSPHVSDDEAHAASHEQISAALARLAGGTTRWINLDALANALKAEGFVRPPGSPRLVTRLRKMKDVEVSPNGMVRLVSGSEPSAEPESGTSPPKAARRPRRRGGRGRRRKKEEPATTNAPSSADTEAAPD
jgi:hypothetical protein